MSIQNKVLAHPDKEIIIKWLTDGIPVREVEARLKEKYPKKPQGHLRISFSTLQQFRTEHLNLKEEVLSAIKEAGQLTRENIRREVISDEVKKTTSYQEKINSIASDQLSVNKELVKVFNLIEDRMEAFYDRIANNSTVDVREERVFQKYLEQFTSVLEHYKKYVEGYTETSNHNININIMNDQVGLIREAVREVLSETEPELAVKFMGKLNSKMGNLIYRADGQVVGDLLLDNAVVV